MSRGQNIMLRQDRTSSFLNRKSSTWWNKYNKRCSCPTIILLYIPDPGLKLLEWLWLLRQLRNRRKQTILQNTTILYRYWFFGYSYLLMVQRSSVAPNLRKFGNPSSREYLVVTWFSVCYMHVRHLLCACDTFSRSFILPLLAYNWKKKPQTVLMRHRWETWSGESCNLT